MQLHEQESIVLFLAASIISCIQITAAESTVRKFDLPSGHDESVALNNKANATGKSGPQTKEHANATIEGRKSRITNPLQTLANGIKAYIHTIRNATSKLRANNPLQSLRKTIRADVNAVRKTINKALKTSTSGRRKRSHNQSKQNPDATEIQQERLKTGSASEKLPELDDLNEGSHPRHPHNI